MKRHYLCYPNISGLYQMESNIMDPLFALVTRFPNIDYIFIDVTYSYSYNSFLNVASCLNNTHSHVDFEK